MSSDPIREVRFTLDPADPAAAAQVAAAFGVLAGRRARLTLHVSGETRVLEGRVPRVSRWTSPDDPCLMLRPGTTDFTHVLAEMAIHLRFLDGCLALARRRHYDTEPLDLQRLPAGRVEMWLVEVPE